MATERQREAAKRNVKMAQEKWQSMSSRQRARSQPEGRARAKPGTQGEGDYYRVEVRPKEAFVTFRHHDVGEPGGIQRLAGKRASGSWDDHAWLISKNRAHVRGNELVGDDPEVQEVLEAIGPAKHLRGDIFEGHPRENVPEKEKPTPAQQRARMENIQKAQEAHRERTA